MPAHLTIHLDRIAANYRTLVRYSGTAHCAAVVKADAYGLGMAAVAPVLAAAGCRLFFVALPHEGVMLRRILHDAGYPQADIAVFNDFQPDLRQLFQEQRLIPVLNTLAQVPHWPQQAYIQVDTGMHRSGLPAADWTTARHQLAAPPRLVISHLACADTPDHPANPQQLTAFRQALTLFQADGSLAASAAILGLGPDCRFAVTRPGAALYGAIPHPEILPVITLTAPILEVRTVPAGAGVGYGLTDASATHRRIATIGIGYADGYPRASAAGSAVILLNQQRLPLVGRVSMDLVTVDVTAAPAAVPGTLVTVWGDDYTINDAAHAAGTIGYEILTRLGQRLSRRYTSPPPPQVMPHHVHPHSATHRP